MICFFLVAAAEDSHGMFLYLRSIENLRHPNQEFISLQSLPMSRRNSGPVSIVPDLLFVLRENYSL